jgi:ribosomal protein L3
VWKNRSAGLSPGAFGLAHPEEDVPGAEIFQEQVCSSEIHKGKGFQGAGKRIELKQEHGL